MDNNDTCILIFLHFDTRRLLSLSVHIYGKKEISFISVPWQEGGDY